MTNLLAPQLEQSFKLDYKLTRIWQSVFTKLKKKVVLKIVVLVNARSACEYEKISHKPHK